MKLSHKLEYACRVLAQLGRRHGADKLSQIESLATAEAIPANYLVQILNELRGAGLIVSKRGKQGGYALAKEPKQITLIEIVEALDSELLEHHFESSGHSGPQVAAIWTEVGEAFEAKLRTYTLKDFVVQADDGGMYYI
ncbi:MAG: Rrf2 family transcriptional regulator [Puniceicoccaceae bacterium]|nr:MAG: Rrf2 family transcriptional regulator [Puniceicoccaceae bacterium]